MPVPSGLLPLRAYYFGSFAALGVFAPFFPRWLEARGVSGLAMGAVSALVPALGILGPPAVGLLADALGLRGSILRIAGAGSALALVALACADTSSERISFAAVFAAVLLYAAFRSPMVMLADVVTMERARAAGAVYGRIRLWGSIGFLVAALAAGRAVDPQARAVLPAVTAALLVFTTAAAWRLPARPGPLGLPVLPEVRALAGAHDFAIFLVISLLAQIAHASYDLCFSLHLGDLGAPGALVGAAWAAGVLFEVALMTVSDALLARFGAPRLLVTAIAGAALRWILIARVTSIPWLFALQPLHTLSFALWWVSSLAFVKARAPAHALATAQGMFSASVAAGSVAGMLAWGTIYRRSGGSAVFSAAGVIALAAAVTAALWARRARLGALHA